MYLFIYSFWTATTVLGFINESKFWEGEILAYIDRFLLLALDNQIARELKFVFHRCPASSSYPVGGVLTLTDPYPKAQFGGPFRGGVTYLWTALIKITQSHLPSPARTEKPRPLFLQGERWLADGERSERVTYPQRIYEVDSLGLGIHWVFKGYGCFVEPKRFGWIGMKFCQNIQDEYHL